MNILEEIRDAEREAAKVRADAAAKARELTREGAAKAADDAAALVGDAKANAERTLDKAGETAAHKATALIADGRTADEKLLAACAPRLAGAVRYIVEEVQKS